MYDMFYCSIKCVRIHIVAKLCCSQYDTQVAGSSTTGNQMAIEGSANSYFIEQTWLQQGVVNDISIYQRTPAPDLGIFERGASPLAVICSITNFLFLIKLYEIIEPRLLEKRGLQPPEPPLWIRPWTQTKRDCHGTNAVYMYCCVRICQLYKLNFDSYKQCFIHTNIRSRKVHKRIGSNCHIMRLTLIYQGKRRALSVTAA